MKQNKKELLNQQIVKIEEILKCLKQNFSDLEIEEK